MIYYFRTFVSSREGKTEYLPPLLDKAQANSEPRNPPPTTAIVLLPCSITDSSAWKSNAFL